MVLVNIRREEQVKSSVRREQEGKGGKVDL